MLILSKKNFGVFVYLRVNIGTIGQFFLIWNLVKKLINDMNKKGNISKFYLIKNGLIWVDIFKTNFKWKKKENEHDMVF